MVVTVFGLGFVGLTTATGFAEKGIIVYGLDVDRGRLDTLRTGKIPFYEPGLDEAYARNLGKHFFLQEDAEAAVKESDCIYYCVGTPYGEGGEADLTYLYQAIDTTLQACSDDKYRVLVTKSTIPPSTTSEKIIPYIEAKGYVVGRQLGVANNPEFLREGSCWEDFIHADRIVLGVSDEKTETILRELYQGFEVPKFAVSLNTGEFIKYLSNTLLATLISYSNEMAQLADTIGNIDVAQAFRILHMDKRWGGCSMSSYVYPGCGYGGYCLPKDTNAIYALGKDKGFDAQILKNVIETNDARPGYMATQIERQIAREDCIGILGLSFKPGSDDVRDTPAAKVLSALIADGYTNIVAYDPLAVEAFDQKYHLPITYAGSVDAVLEQAKEVVILTAWKEFSDVPARTQKKIVDCRYMF
ncbi:MAG: nucleotide sugar dehydrogenase [Ruminococcus flavefaciens]|nr:nucleotide sugar dehydrogenase [Ruminococcus flavefaciens]